MLCWCAIEIRYHCLRLLAIIQYQMACATLSLVLVVELGSPLRLVFLGPPYGFIRPAFRVILIPPGQKRNTEGV